MAAYKTGVLPRLVSKLVRAKLHSKMSFLDKFSENIGVAFQIQDDIIALTSELYHKTRGIGEDIWEGKRSLVVVHSIESHSEAKAERL